MSANTIRAGANLRLYLLCSILVLWCCAICLRLVYLQTVRYGDFVQRAQHQQQRTVDVAAKRGIIYDRAGRELAMSITVDSVFAVPSEVPDLGPAISLISRITHDDPRELLARCQAVKSFCWLARKADADTADRIRALNLRGIHFQKEPKRFYPKRDLTAQVIGYVGTDDEGLSGIERQYNARLRGKPGRLLISVDARRRWFGSVQKQPEPGENIVLTIDEKIQYIAERELEAAVAESNAESGTVIVQDPRTGEVLGLANRPTFNPNLSREITPAKLKDHAVSDVYEPGSTFKIVAIAGALEEKLTRPQEIFDCQMGSIVINGHRIHDWKPYGNLSVADILAHSSDVGAIKIALRLGEERFYKYIRDFGFGQKTGIELPAETRGLTKPLDRWSKVSIGAISMGQEIGVSPVQLAAAISAIANDGTWVAPRIVAGTTAPNQPAQTIAFHPVGERRVISPLASAQMKQMLQGVVLHGTGKKAILEGYSSAGKTGTAQKIDPATGTYSRTKYIASFAGFAPVNSPVVTVVVVLDSPRGRYHGGDVGAPVFQRIAQQVLEYLHAPHDVELPNRRMLLAERRVQEKDVAEGSPDRLGEGLNLAEAGTPETPPLPISPEPANPEVSEARPEALRQVTAGPGASTAHREMQVGLVGPGTSRPATGTVVLEVEQSGVAVPSFIGKTVRSAVEVAQDNGLELDAIGSGVARDQFPAPGEHVAPGGRVTVHFGR